MYYVHPKQSDVEYCIKGLIEKYNVQGFPLEAKEFEMRIDRFINYSNINNSSKVLNINCNYIILHANYNVIQ